MERQWGGALSGSDEESPACEPEVLLVAADGREEAGDAEARTPPHGVLRARAVSTTARQ